MLNIGANIRAARRHADLTQEQLSDSIGITRQHLSEIERGLICTSIPTLIEICKQLNVSADYILFGGSIGFGNENITLIEKIRMLPKDKADFIETGVDLLLASPDLPAGGSDPDKQDE